MTITKYTRSFLLGHVFKDNEGINYAYELTIKQGFTLTFFLGGPIGPLKSLIIHF